MGFSVVCKEDILNVFFNGDDTLIPTDLYVGLAISSISTEDTLETINEEDDENYERQIITFSAPYEDSEGDIVVENDSLIEFPTWAADATSTITWAFITDANSGTTGKMFVPIELDESKQPQSGEKLSIPAGEFVAGFEEVSE